MILKSSSFFCLFTWPCGSSWHIYVISASAMAFLQFLFRGKISVRKRIGVFTTNRREACHIFIQTLSKMPVGISATTWGEVWKGSLSRWTGGLFLWHLLTFFWNDVVVSICHWTCRVGGGNITEGLTIHPMVQPNGPNIQLDRGF